MKQKNLIILIGVFLLLLGLLTFFFVLNKDKINTSSKDMGIPIGCKMYFDGCNNCLVGENNELGCTKMFCEYPKEPKCLEFDDKKSTNQYEEDEENEEITMCTMEYMPVCAEIKTNCQSENCVKQYETFGNKCVMGNNKNAVFVYEGECL